MRVAFSKLEWGGIALLVMGPVLHLAGNVLAQREISRGQDRYREMIASIRPDIGSTAGEGSLTRALGTAKEKSSAALSHWSKVTSYNYAAYVGFALFLFGIGLFLVGGRLRSLTAKLNSTGIHTRAEPSDGSDPPTPGEGEGPDDG